jgi:hypothetical protein
MEALSFLLLLIIAVVLLAKNARSKAMDMQLLSKLDSLQDEVKKLKEMMAAPESRVEKKEIGQI